VLNNYGESIQHQRKSLCLKAHSNRRSRGCRRTGHDVVIVVGGREIIAVEEVLDVDLRLDVGGELEERGGIDAGERRQDGGIADGGEAFCLVVDADPGSQARGEVVAGPERSLLLGHKRDLAAGRSRTRCLADFCVLQRVAGADLPLGCDRAVEADLKPFAALRAR